MNDIIETERLILRPFNINDAVAFYNISIQKEVTRYMTWNGCKDLD